MNTISALENRSVEDLLGQVADEFTQQLNRGEQPDIEEYARRYPQIAAVLRQVLPALQVLRVPARDLAASGDADFTQASATGCLGDYRILREIGRGGMGVVYEAEQISLGRRVALKVLPFAATLDPKQLQRFKNEAQAAAQLHHTNIVPVFGVGVERGVHYYAMQYIEGQTLAAMIRELRQLTGLETADRTDAAGLIAKLASELVSGHWAPPRPKSAADQPTGPYAPPSVGRERVAGAERSDAPDRGFDSLSPGHPDIATAPVAAISTERSTKSPAFFRTVANLGIQAAEALEHAHSLGVVHRDIKPANLLVDGRGNLWITDFGLAHCQSQAGLTMTGDLVGTLRYMSPEQALAKRVLVDHRTDIYSLGASLYELLTLEPVFSGHDRQELLRQIAFEEPKPPRRLNKNIPKELETIVLKAMEKNPADRYASAGELADDLKRYLKDEPIRARRPSLIHRTRKWCRRHQAFVWSVTAVLTLGVLMALASLGITNQRIARENKRIAGERDEARAQRRRAREAVDTMYTQVAEKWLGKQPGMEELQREFLTAALGFYKEFAAEESTEPEHQFETAFAYQRVARLQVMVFREHSQAEAALLQSIDILEKLSQRFPDEPRYTDVLAFGYFLLGWARAENVQEEEKWQRRAVDLWEQLVAAYPTERRYRQRLAQGLFNLSNPVGYSGRRGEAEMICRRAITVMEGAPSDMPRTALESNTLAGSYDNLACSLEDAGRLSEALESFKKCIELELPFAGRNPDVPDYKLGMDPWGWMNFGTRHSQVGNLLRRTGKCEEARPYIERSIRIHEQLVASFPKTGAYAEHLHGCYVSLGRLEQARGQKEAAQKAYKEALRIAEQLAVEQPSLGLGQLGIFLLICPDARFRDPERASDLLEKLIAIKPEHADSWQRLSLAKCRIGKYEAALDSARKARHFGGEEYWAAGFVQAMAHWQLDEKEKARQCYHEAATWLENNHSGDEILCHERDEAAALLGVKEIKK